MITIKRRRPPVDFDAKVRTPGEAARLAGANPLPDHWKHCRGYLYEAYGKVCSYASIPIHDISGVKSVDHFRPKSKYPHDTYKWSNYRLACGRINSRKREFEDVLDPFKIGKDWFTLDFTDGSIKPASHLPPDIKKEVAATIKRLGLDTKTFRKSRLKVIERYLKKDYSFNVIQSDWPHLAREMIRQGFLLTPP